MPNNSIFYELVGVALGQRELLSRAPSNEEWHDLIEISKKQAVAGVVFLALDKLSNGGIIPPLDVLYEWIGLSEQIKQRNKSLYKRCKEVSQLFTDAGYRTCILKGQGNARIYTDPFSRTAGDIDIWLYGKIEKPDISINILRDEIVSFVRERKPDAFEQSYHIEFPIFNDAMVEVHYEPIILASPNINRRFRKWYKEAYDEIMYSNDVSFFVPSVHFNVVYQIVHMYSHFFTEGIGLRHFIDYFYVLKNNVTPHTELKVTLKYLKMERFARGVMWIEKYCFGLDDNYLPFEPSEKLGRLILKEMEEGGNFGQYDQRYFVRNKGLLMRGMADVWRLIKLLPYFPSDCLWKITEKIYNQKWKIKDYVIKRYCSFRERRY